MSSPQGKLKMRNRSKSIHTSVPHSLENEEKPDAPSDEEMEITELEQVHSDGEESGEWSSGDEEELVKNIRQFTSKSDKLKYTTRIHRLDWKKVAFKNYTPKECQTRFTKYLKMVRTYRTLHEILSDVEEEIKRIPFKKPLNSYQLYVQDQLSKAQSSGDFANRMRNLATMYKNLSPQERDVYDQKSKQALNEYNKRKMEYLAEKNPEGLKTPFFLFSEHWKLKDNKLNATQIKHKYEELSQNEKYKWVEKAVQLNEGISVTSFLNKDEQRLYRGLPKSVGTPYSMFVKDMYAKVKGTQQEGNSVFTEIAQKWKNLPASEKEKYKKACDKLKQEALNETKAINEKFGVKVNKKKAIAKTKSKKHKSKETVISDDENDVSGIKKEPVSPQKGSKKRKSSVNEPTEEANGAKRLKKDKSAAKETEFASPAPITSTPHVKSKKRSDTITSEDTADDDTSAGKFMVKIPMSQLTDDQSDTSTEKKKKKKKDKSSEKKPTNSIHESEAEASTSSSVSGGKKKKNKDKSPQKNSDKLAHDSEAEASTSNSVSVSKKKKKTTSESLDKVPPPGEKPPRTLEEYYAKYVYSGKPRKLQKSFDKLTEKEKQELTVQHNEKIEKYVGQMKTYLLSLPKEEAIMYVSKIKADEVEEARASQNENGESQDY